jgi:ATP-dependent RNA helicase DDX3X
MQSRHVHGVICRCMQGLTLIFVDTKQWADQLTQFLIDKKYPATTIHGDLTQEEREFVSTLMPIPQCY